MPIPAGVTKVVFGGSLNGGEHWQSGFWLTGDQQTSNELANALCELVWDDITGTDVDGLVYHLLNDYGCEGMTLNYVRAYVYTGNPKATYIGEHTGTFTGSQVNPRFPNQVCIVASLRTAQAGRRHRGRMFLPVGFATLTGTGQLANSDAAAIAGHVGAFISDWNASGDNGTVVVVSSAGSTSAAVTSVIVDSRLDIQRGRAKSQSIDYRAVSVITS